MNKILQSQFGLLAINFISLSIKHQTSCSAFAGFLLLMNKRDGHEFQHLVWTNKKILKKAYGKCISATKKRGGNPSEQGVEDLLIAAQLHERKWLLSILIWWYLIRLFIKCFEMEQWDYYCPISSKVEDINNLELLGKIKISSWKEYFVSLFIDSRSIKQGERIAIQSSCLLMPNYRLWLNYWLMTHQ